MSFRISSQILNFVNSPWRWGLTEMGAGAQLVLPELRRVGNPTTLEVNAIHPASCAQHLNFGKRRSATWAKRMYGSIIKLLQVHTKILIYRV
jgi:hypothetical protein